jgi:transposase
MIRLKISEGWIGKVVFSLLLTLSVVMTSFNYQTIAQSKKSSPTQITNPEKTIYNDPIRFQTKDKVYWKEARKGSFFMGRRKWTAEQKMEIVLAGMAPGANISAVCREYGIVQTQYYKWREAFIQGGLSALKTGISNREQELEKELEKAKALIGEKEIQIEILRKKTNWGRR